MNRNIIAGVVAARGTLNKRKCILAGALGSRVFPRFGFEASAIPYETYAFHQRYRPYFDLTHAFGDRHVPHRYAGADSGDGAEINMGKTWHGHLALDVQGGIVDAVAGQFTRLAIDPDTGKVLGSPDDFLVPDSALISAERCPVDNITQFAEFSYAEGDAVLMYRQQPHNTDYLNDPFWTLSAELDAIANEIEADVRNEWSQRSQGLPMAISTRGRSPLPKNLILPDAATTRTRNGLPGRSRM